MVPENIHATEYHVRGGHDLSWSPGPGWWSERDGAEMASASHALAPTYNVYVAAAPMPSPTPAAQSAQSSGAARDSSWNAPTQRQVSYLAMLCERKRVNFKGLMREINTKTQASQKIEELVKS